ncbi:hypothetical protein BJ138DRAFT_1083314 [Hygrophoropsis aurantiaca]|uniref:Uncharacterized protein n=1 Tax=Hygrophoropsis aurantiaca TaxID=72124 RepID=A0ACB8AGB5_9AGAM|nr:hypothetical protein BJ138DRAFT_1083314 [Hygrophoropsis aurantiaca]
MPSPPIQVFLTTIASQPVLRKRQEYILRILQTKKIPYTSYDLASDEDAKRLWKRKAPLDKQQLPGILVGGRYPGTFDEFEEAVEYDELDIFLRLKESWNAAIDEDRPALAVKPVGVPGAVPVSEMTPEHHKPKIFPPSDSPLKGKGKVVPVNKRVGDFDVSTELEGFGLQGVRVTDDDLRKLVEDLGLDGDDAADMVKSLGGDASSEHPESKSENQLEKEEPFPAITTTVKVTPESK